MIRRRFLQALGVGGASALLSGCTYRSESYRYKLTLSLNTPDGVKTGSVVHEFTTAHAYSLLNGEVYPYGFRGEALFVDLGPGRKPLITTLKGRCHKTWAPFCVGENGMNYESWDIRRATNIFSERWDHITSGDPQWLDAFPRWKAQHAHLDLAPIDLPELVTFDDINDQTTLHLVDPFHLEDVLGPGISWNAITIEVVDAPLIYSLDKKLPWFAKLLKEEKYTQRGANLDGATISYAPASGKSTLLNYFALSSFQTYWRPDDGK